MRPNVRAVPPIIAPHMVRARVRRIAAMMITVAVIAVAVMMSTGKSVLRRQKQRQGHQERRNVFLKHVSPFWADLDRPRFRNFTSIRSHRVTSLDRQNDGPETYFFFFGAGFLACAKSEAATVFSSLVDFLLESSFDAFDAAFFPVVIIIPR